MMGCFCPCYGIIQDESSVVWFDLCGSVKHGRFLELGSVLPSMCVVGGRLGLIGYGVGYIDMMGRSRPCYRIIDVSWVVIFVVW